VFLDESGFLLIPNVRQTWAPVGCTPTVRHSYKRDKLSGGKMNYRGNVRPVVFADHEESFPHALARRDVNGYGGAAGWRRVGCLAVETDNIVKSSGKPPHNGIANRSVGACSNDNPALRFELSEHHPPPQQLPGP
jgi:hypothetical protein